MPLLHTSLKNPLDRVRTLGIFEGWSFLLLLFIAMPLKYGFALPLAVTIVGALHGILFVAYWAVIIEATITDEWPPKRAALLLAAAIIPFGPFIAEARILKPLADKNHQPNDAPENRP